MTSFMPFKAQTLASPRKSFLVNPPESRCFRPSCMNPLALVDVLSLLCVPSHYISFLYSRNNLWALIVCLPLCMRIQEKNPCQRGILNVGGNRKYRANHITTFKGNNIHKYKGLRPSFSCVYGYITKRCVCFLRAGPASYIYFVLSYAQIKGCVMIDWLIHWWSREVRWFA